MDDIIRAVSAKMPSMNKFLLKTWTQNEINGSIAFIDTTFKQAVKLIPGAVDYMGYSVLSPEERVKFELGGNKSGNGKRQKIKLATSEMQLVEFKFQHEGHYVDSVYLYTPYMHHDMLVVRDKEYAVHRGIVEQVFSRVSDKTTDGVMVRPIRLPITINRRLTKKIISSVTGQVVMTEFIVASWLHSKPHGKRRIDTTAIHYLMCKYGFYNVITKLGLSRDDLVFVDHPKLDDPYHEYFSAKLPSKLNDLHLRVRKDILSHVVYRKLVTNILYTLQGFDVQTKENLVEPYGSIWRVMLGKIIEPNADLIAARSAMDVHIASVDVFIDPLSKQRFNEFGVRIDDIYDLLFHVFVEIDQLMISSTAQNLYDKRVDVTHGILVEAYAKPIFGKFYKTNQKTVLKDREVKALLRIKSMVIDNAWAVQRKGGTRNVSTAPQRYGDSWLASCGIFKTRLAGVADQRFHPSMAVVESLVAFSGANVGVSGLVNPYLKIGANGGIIESDYAQDINELLQYLPE